MPSSLKTTLQILDFVFLKKKTQKPNTAVQRNKITITPRTLDSFFIALLPLWVEIKWKSQPIQRWSEVAEAWQQTAVRCFCASPTKRVCICLYIKKFCWLQKGTESLCYSKWVCALLTVGSFAALLKGKWGSLSWSESVACGWAKAWSSLCHLRDEEIVGLLIS